MASKTERTVVNAAGLVQGIVLVTFPAASTIFTSRSEYGLARRITTKRVYLLGLTVPVLNTYTSVFNPGSVDRSVLALNALLGPVASRPAESPVMDGVITR